MAKKIDMQWKFKMGHEQRTILLDAALENGVEGTNGDGFRKIFTRITFMFAF